MTSSMGLALPSRLAQADSGPGMDAAEFPGFAERWLAAWNSHDLNRILALYAADALIRTPRAASWDPSTGGIVQGLANVRRYWSAALEASPNLRLELDSVLTSVGGGTILYRNHRSEFVAETVAFDEAGLIEAAVVSYRPI